MPAAKHLWEYDHPYYCSESNFYSREPFCAHKSWDDFASSMGASDPELNLCFRWDWHPPRNEDDDETIEWKHDENYRESYINLFFVMQRKGIFCCHEVQVARTDEPAIRKWLTARMPHLLQVWEPINVEKEEESHG